MPKSPALSNYSNSDLEGLSEKSKLALVHLALEGIHVSKKALADMKLLDSGVITSEELLAKVRDRAKKSSV